MSHTNDFSVAHDHVEKTHGGGFKKIVEVVANDPKTKVGSVVKRLGAAHGFSSERYD